MGKNSSAGQGNHIDLRALFTAHQEQLLSRLRTAKGVVSHPTARGDTAELDWIGMLRDFLPSRYQVSKAFVIDASGAMSRQIDIVIHDRHFSPLLFNREGAVYLPAESVYAVFEVKSTLHSEHIDYAGENAASVRTVRRTSMSIPHAGGKYRPRKPFRILAGIVALDAMWQGSLKRPLEQRLGRLAREQRLDLGCVVERGGFEVTYAKGSQATVALSQPDLSVSYFVLRLIAKLQRLATVPAIDIDAYLETGLAGVHRSNES